MTTTADWTIRMRAQIEQALAAAFSAQPQTEVLRAARYVTQGGGHRWRGLLALAAGAIFRSDAETCALPLAAALEMMHAASLVLDDLPTMDDALERRGKACVHRVFPGWAVDMLPAFLVNLAYRTSVDNPLVPEGCRIRSLLLLGEMGARLAQGQEQDLALAATSEPALLECYALKSGSLFAAALASGGLLCGAGPADAQTLNAAGVKLGQAYQLLDDLADGGEDPGKTTACTLLSPAAVRARAESLLAEVAKLLAPFGAAADPLRGLLDEVLRQETG